jgi:hypothetical protein
LFTIDMVFEQGIDFRRFKAGETKINTGVCKEGTKFRELDGQRGAIPPAFLCKFIVAVYGLRTRARCVHSPDPAMLDYGSVTILGTGEGFETLCTIASPSSLETASSPERRTTPRPREPSDRAVALQRFCCGAR